ncbi:MAG: acyltransferase [Candidatus Beckwithbacteria bacterium]|nr:acyltransferase [Patescibacteria group bacterium]
MSSLSINKDRLTVGSIKGIAILAVIFIHLFTLLTQKQFTVSPQNLIFLFLDQIMRFCVPVFIFLSGYGLELSCQQKNFDLKSFIKKRSLTILPLYFLWSAYYIALSILIIPWWKVLSGWSVSQIIFNGRADYHLYFVPVIFKLYLVFALLKKLPKKLFLPLFYCAIIFQLYFYSYFTIKTPFISDQLQHSNILVWAGYFMLGIWLANKEKFLSKRNSLILIIFGLGLSVFEAFQVVGKSGDVIQAIRFAKLSNIFYSIGLIGLFLISTSKILKNKYLSWFGQNSYLIYLAHPLPLHLLKFDLSLVPIIPTLLSYVFVIFLSIVIQKSARKL